MFPSYAKLARMTDPKHGEIKVRVEFDQPSPRGWVRTAEVLIVPHAKGHTIVNEIHGCRRCKATVLAASTEAAPSPKPKKASPAPKAKKPTATTPKTTSKKVSKAKA